MEGRILGNRYELLEKIGGGGMAIVYKAKCNLLNRYVAVKILRPEFTNDEEFVKRFKVEAQSAASLSHPNIVSIHDVGNDGDLYYIIMEYVDGITLKEYIDSRGVLPWREATNIAIQICSAIEHAHRNHIVHRDIKPHNILITKDGVAKVTDFGIARAVSSSTITMVGSTIGSVHYFSPEQARGGFVDEKSDLYSLGITVYEMVTGRLPFNGETPIAVALQHIQQDARAPIDINMNIPQSINDIIMKAIRKEQNKRYQSAPELLADLNMVLRNPGASVAAFQQEDESPTRRIKALNEEQEIRRADYLIEDDEEEPAKKAKKGDRLTKWLAVATAVVVILFVSFLVYNNIIKDVMPEKTKDFVVDSYVGKNINEVKSTLADSGIKEDDIKVDEEYNKDYPAGVIYQQSLDKGQTLKPGGYTPIEFKVSKGPELIKLEDYTNQDSRKVEEAITNLGLVTSMKSENNDSVPVNSVIRTEPGENEMVEANSTVTIVVSTGPLIKTTIVPDLTNLSQKEAIQRLTAANLKVGKYIPDIGSNYTGKIVTQLPLPNSVVDQGSSVDIYFQNDTPAAPKNQSIVLNLTLNSPSEYGDTVKVRIETTAPNAAQPQPLKEYAKNKTEFPYTETLSLPSGTQVKVFYDGALALSTTVP